MYDCLPVIHELQYSGNLDLIWHLDFDICDSLGKFT